MKFKSVILLLFCTLLVVAACRVIASADERIATASDYIVTCAGEKTVRILNIPTHLMWEETFDSPIKKLEICSSSPFISVVTKERALYIYDIEHCRRFELGGGNEYEQRWSENGKFTFINRGSNFLIIQTADLRQYLLSRDESFSLVKI